MCDPYTETPPKSTGPAACPLDDQQPRTLVATSSRMRRRSGWLFGPERDRRAHGRRGVELDGSTVQLSEEGAMSSVQPLIDAAGRRHSPAAMPGFRTGKAPRNKGQRYPADPPTVEEIIAVMREAHTLATATASRD